MTAQQLHHVITGSEPESIANEILRMLESHEEWSNLWTEQTKPLLVEWLKMLEDDCFVANFRLTLSFLGMDSDTEQLNRSQVRVHAVWIGTQPGPEYRDFHVYLEPHC